MEFFRKACGRIPAREEEVMWFRLAKISMIIGWTPFILAFLPGSIPADGFRQLDVFLGAMPLDNHHPWVLTMIMGGLLTLGKTIWCYNFGVFLIIIVFTSVEIWCYSAVVRYLYRWKAPMDTFWYCSAVCICSHIWKLCAGSDQRWIIYGSHYFVFCSVYRYLSFLFQEKGSIFISSGNQCLSYPK